MRLRPPAAYAVAEGKRARVSGEGWLLDALCLLMRAEYSTFGAGARQRKPDAIPALSGNFVQQVAGFLSRHSLAQSAFPSLHK